ncbi:MAG: UDP-N-acetylmuramoyl-L-alanine--D-glutamate ligase [Anaerolineae bacterium]
MVILGLARQGVALARYLTEAGAEVTVSDLQDENALADRLEQIADLSVDYALGGHPIRLLDDADLVCVSGGVPLDIPFVEEALRRNIPLSNDVQIFLDRCPATVIGITGSAGKTTTTALVGEMCRAAGLRTWVGGNIGNPLIGDVGAMEPEDLVVMELSSFQLALMTTSPHVAAVLNITPNHLDRHKTMEAYIAAKQNIVAHQTGDDMALLGYDDANARAMALETPAQLFFFSGGAEVDAGAFKTNGELTLRMNGVDREICKASEVQLLGRHNVLNILAASSLASMVGVPLQAIRDVATSFSGVDHRLELVQEWTGVRWYDDSIATAPERSLAAIRSFEDPIILLAGGRDKDLPWDAFAEETLRRVRHLITFGEAGPMIADEVEAAAGRNGSVPARNHRATRRLEGITRVESLDEAVDVAARLAEPGDVVLLSPGGTSFDAFRDFAERGERFSALARRVYES